jgi:hypothetical protein
MPIDPVTQRIVNELMEDPTATVQMFAGMKLIAGSYAKGSAEFEPTGAKTVVIEVKGGSNNVRIERIKIEGEEDEDA